MGASTGTLLVQDDEGVEQVLRHVNRRAAFHSEDEYRLAERRPLARTGDWTSHPEVRDAQSAIQSTHRLVRHRHRAGQAHPRAARDHRATRSPSWPPTRTWPRVEVTPQHLTLAGPEAYERLKGYAQMNPPIRGAEHRAALWAGVASGVADVLGSDHAPHTREEKARPYPASPSGMPGVQTLLPVMLTHVAEGRLSLERLVDLTSHGANRVFGLADKGRLAEGYDADLTIVDLKARRTITPRRHGHPRPAGRRSTAWRPRAGRWRRSSAAAWSCATTRSSPPDLGEPVRFRETLSS